MINPYPLTLTLILKLSSSISLRLSFTSKPNPDPNTNLTLILTPTFHSLYALTPSPKYHDASNTLFLMQMTQIFPILPLQTISGTLPKSHVRTIEARLPKTNFSCFFLLSYPLQIIAKLVIHCHRCK